MGAVIRLENVHKTYDTGEVKVYALRGISLTVEQGEFVAIARSLINQPQVVLADEPTGNLDSRTGGEILSEFQRLNRDLGQTILLITHDPSIAAVASRLVTFRDGLIASDVVHRPTRGKGDGPYQIETEPYAAPHLNGAARELEPAVH